MGKHLTMQNGLGMIRTRVKFSLPYDLVLVVGRGGGDAVCEAGEGGLSRFAPLSCRVSLHRE